MVSLLVWLLPRCPRTRGFVRWLAAIAVASVGAAPAADVAGPGAGLGVAMVPQDAAFVSSSLRLREQWNAVVHSNAFRSILALPAVRRGFDSLDEQRATPGTLVSTLDTFMQLPENAAALALLSDMLATDTFVYGEPSCVAFARLMRAVAGAQRRASADPAGDDGGAAIVIGSGPDDPGPAVTADLQARAVLAAVAANLDLLEVPDVVWGFTTTQRDVAVDQIARLEAAATRMLAGGSGVARRQIAGGEMLVLTLDGESLPWEDLEREAVSLTDDPAAVDRVFDRLRTLDLVLAIGLVGDRVIVSLGDSADHLAKLVAPGSSRGSLLELPALAPVRRHAGERLTGVAYVSEPLCAVMGTSRSDVESVAAIADQLDAMKEVPADVRREVRGLTQRAVAEWTRRIPEPGPWASCSFLTGQGYEGYAWDFARNHPFDASRRLDLLEHAGGAPLAVAVSRMRADPAGFDAAVGIAGAAWALVERQAAGDGMSRETLAALGDLGARLATIVRDKFGKSLADGQIGLVLDAKGRTKRVQAELPPSADPLPLVEPAIVLPLADARLFREGLNDLFELADELTETLRTLRPDAVPEGYRIPEPELAKMDEGGVWSWRLEAGRLDEQLRPSIGVGDRTAVLSLSAKQPGRLLVESRLETGSQLTRFDEPLASAAAVDVAGIIAAIEPWIVYLTRYGCVLQREGSVDPEVELTADDESPQAREVLEHVRVALAAMQSLRVGVVETTVEDDALVTHWRNVIRDTPAE